MGELVERHQPRHRHAIAIGDAGEGFTRLDGVFAGVPVHRCGAGGGGGSGHHQPGALRDHVGVADAVELDQALHRGAEPVGDLGEGFAWFHRVTAAPAAAGRGGAGAGRAGHGEPGASCDLIRILDAVELHQTVEGHAIARGDLRERLPGLHHVLGGQSW